MIALPPPKKLFLFKVFLGAFLPYALCLANRERKLGRETGDDMQQRAACWTRPWAAAARTHAFAHEAHASGEVTGAPQVKLLSKRQ